MVIAKNTKILKYGAGELRRKSESVAVIDQSYYELKDRMVEIMIKVDGLGLAAPQIGIHKRLFVYQISKISRMMINPEILEYSDAHIMIDEGCLSMPGITVPISRPRDIFVRGYDLIKGETVEFESTYMLARLFQHELEHLNGGLMIDNLTDEERKKFLKQWRLLNARRKK